MLEMLILILEFVQFKDLIIFELFEDDLNALDLAFLSVIMDWLFLGFLHALEGIHILNIFMVCFGILIEIVSSGLFFGVIGVWIPVAKG